MSGLVLILYCSVLVGIVPGSSQKCFTAHCQHHAPLAECLGGSWACQPEEYCQISTHTLHNTHSNTPIHHLTCRPSHTLSDCLAVYAQNHETCHADNYNHECNYCCADEMCVHNLSVGIYSPPASSNEVVEASSTMSPPAFATAETLLTTSTSATPVLATATMLPALSQTLGPDTITPKPSAETTHVPGCDDVYAGFCSDDFAGRCEEPLVQQLCGKYCNVC